MKVKKVLAIVLALLLFACGLSACSFGSLADANTVFNSHISANEYTDAIEVYQTRIAGNAEKENKAATFLIEYYEDVIGEYAAGTIDDGTAKAAIDCLNKVEGRLNLLGYYCYDINDRYQSLQQSKSNYKAANNAESNDELANAIVQYSLVISNDAENYQTAQEKMSTLKGELIENALNLSQEYLNNNDFERAESIILETKSTLQSISADTNELEGRLNDITVARYSYTINKYGAEENYADAILAYNNFCLTAAIPPSAEMTTTIADYKVLYRHQVVEDSKKVYFENGAQSAGSIVEDALGIMPEDVTLEKLYDLYQSALPTTHVYYEEKDAVTDSDYIRFVGQGSSESIMAYYPKKEYTNMRTHFSIRLDKYDVDYAQLKVYLDDNLVYDSGRLDYTFDGKDLDFNIENVNKITFSMKGPGSRYSFSGGMANAAYLLMDYPVFTHVLSEEEINSVLD